MVSRSFSNACRMWSGLYPWLVPLKTQSLNNHTMSRRCNRIHSRQLHLLRGQGHGELLQECRNGAILGIGIGEPVRPSCTHDVLSLQLRPGNPSTAGWHRRWAMHLFCIPTWGWGSKHPGILQVHLLCPGQQMGYVRLWHCRAFSTMRSNLSRWRSLNTLSSCCQWQFQRCRSRRWRSHPWGEPHYWWIVDTWWS